MTTEQAPANHLRSWAPIGNHSAALAASVALGRLLRLNPETDLTTIRFTIEDQPGEYCDPGPYVVAAGSVLAVVPDECPSCHTHAGHPHTDYCQLENRDYPGQPGVRADRPPRDHG